MTFEYIDTPTGLAQLVRELSNAPSIALDLEAAGFHRYSDRVCLMQITVPDPDGRNWIVDPLALDVSDALRPVLENPEVPIYMHGSDFDLRLLDRDLGIHLRGLYDTQAVASMLGESSLGLAALLEKYLDVKLAKKYQRADWAKRPLSEDMLRYAAADTAYLHELVSLLTRRLEESGRGPWASEEFRILESIRFEEDTEADPVLRVKRARDLSPRELERLREGLEWRDAIARREDRAPFRVISDQILMQLASDPPQSAGDMASRSGVNGRLAKSDGPDLLDRYDRVAEMEEGDLRGYPRSPGNGRGRPSPEVEALADRLKSVRNRRAEALGLDRGTLMPNAVILEIALEEPGDRSGLERIEGIKAWQIEAVGTELLTAMNGTTG